MEPQDNVQYDEFGNPIPAPMAPAPGPIPPQPSAPMAPAPGPLPPDAGMVAVPDYMTGQPVYVPQNMMPQAPGMASPPAPKAPAPDRIPAPPPSGMGNAGMGGPQYGTTSTTDTRNSEMGAAGQEAWAQAGKQVEQAAKAKMDAEVGLNNAKAAHDTAVGNSLMIDAQQREAANQAHFDEVKRRQMDIDRTVAELANTKIDASHFWADKSTGDKIAVGIAMMLGAMGQAKAAQAQNPDANAMSQNPVAIQMDRLIEADLAQQKFNYENKKNTLQNQKGLLSDLMAQYQDMNKAKDVARATYYEALKNQFEGIAVTSKNEIARANAAMMTAEMAAKAADARGKASTHETITKSVTAPLTKGAGQESVKPLEKNVMDAMGEAKGALTATKNLREIFEAVPDDQFGPLANVILEQKKNFGMRTDPEAQQAWEAAMGGAMAAYKVLSPGTLTKFDIDLALKLAPSLKNKESAMNTISRMEKDAIRAYQDRYNEYDANWGGEGSRFRHVFKPYEAPVKKSKTGLK